YNRLTAQTLIVAANAEAEGTKDATKNFKTLVGAFQTGDTSISGRLKGALASADNAAASFTGLAASNSTRMLHNSKVQNIDTAFQGAYIDKASATNISLDKSILPDGVKLPANTLSSATGRDGKPYINGYVDIGFQQLPSLAGASVHPNQQPHLVSEVDF